MAKKKNRNKPSRRGVSTLATARNDRSLILWTIGGVALLCLVHFVLAVTSVLHKSNTYDELAHLTRGYSYWMTDDYRLGPPHPPLAHYWAALPGHFANPKFTTLKQDAWYKSDVWTVGRQFFYYKNLGNAEIGRASCRERV